MQAESQADRKVVHDLLHALQAVKTASELKGTCARESPHSCIDARLPKDSYCISVVVRSSHAESGTAKIIMGLDIGSC